jgi:uncharacterized protein (DUF433 family)
MDWKQYISTDPNILHGAICFAGTRVPVTVVLDNLADGAAPAEILRQYPTLRAEHVPAALSRLAQGQQAANSKAVASHRTPDLRCVASVSRGRNRNRSWPSANECFDEVLRLVDGSLRPAGCQRSQGYLGLPLTTSAFLRLLARGLVEER